jgi:hypothetical protein
MTATIAEAGSRDLAVRLRNGSNQGTSTWMDRDPTAAIAARTVGAGLVDAATGP